MAHIIPEGWQALEATGAAQREIETLALLAAGLSDAYTVYHGVHWTRVNQGHALVGEIDFAIVNPAGDLLLIEQKSGFLSETADGLAKQYDKQEKLVSAQMNRSAEALPHKAQRVVEALDQLRRHHIVMQGLVGVTHPLRELQDEIALMHPLGDGDDFLHQGHDLAPMLMTTCIVLTLFVAFS